MEFTGEIKGIARDWNTNQFNITFSVNESSVINEIDKLKDSKLSIKAVKYRNKRSLDSNAYAWVLMQKIAEAVNADKWFIYLRSLERYSRAYTHVVVKPQAVERMKELYRTCIDLGEVSVNGISGHQLQVYYGSSTFNTKEMSVFIDGIVSECKELGIETLPDEELERMKAAWNQ
jgi:hypothetical protein